MPYADPGYSRMIVRIGELVTLGVQEPVTMGEKLALGVAIGMAGLLAVGWLLRGDPRFDFAVFTKCFLILNTKIEK